MERGRVRPLPAPVPLGPALPSLCGRRGKGTEKADGAGELALCILRTQELESTEKYYLIEIRENTTIKIIPNTFYQCFIFKNR